MQVYLRTGRLGRKGNCEKQELFFSKARQTGQVEETALRLTQIKIICILKFHQFKNNRRTNSKNRIACQGATGNEIWVLKWMEEEVLGMLLRTSCVGVVPRINCDKRQKAKQSSTQPRWSEGRKNVRFVIENARFFFLGSSSALGRRKV